MTKTIVFSALLSLCLPLPLLAQDEAPASIEEPAAVPPVEAVEEPAPQPAPEPAPPAVKADASAPQLKFLQEAFAAATKEVLPSLLEQAQEHLEQYADSEGADEARYLKARIQEAMGDAAGAAATLLKTLYLHPDTRLALTVKRDLLRIADKRFKRSKQAVVEAAQHPGEGLPAAEREPAFLRALSDLGEDALQAPLIAEADAFLRRNPAHPSAGEATLLMAQAYEAAGRHAAALLLYRKVLSLYPDKALGARAQTAVGDLYAKALKDYDKAVEAYQAVTERYAGSAEAGAAYLRMAEVLEKNLKQPALAAEVYEKVVKLQPKSPAALAALREQVRIHKDAKDFARQAKTLERIGDGFPEDKDAAAALWEAGIIYEERVEDAALARKVYARLIDRYPVGTFARKAKKRLDALNQ